MRSWGKGPAPFIRPEGKIRGSQIVTTFGPGAMVDLVDHAVVVGGLDFWRDPRPRPIPEARLQSKLAVQFGPRLTFRAPPMGDDQMPDKQCGVDVVEMPEWFVCQRCRTLFPIRERVRRGHECERNQYGTCVPVRFVASCRRGHLDDFPWRAFVHGTAGPCDRARLKLEEGTTGDLADVHVACQCGARRFMSDATNPVNLGRCSGKRPWLGRDATEGCEEMARLLIRTATNSYFSQPVSAISIPSPWAEVRERVERVWDVLQAADANSLPAFRKVPKVAKELAGLTDDDVLAEIKRRQEGEPISEPPLRTAEFVEFMRAPDEKTGELPAGDFFARRLVAKKGIPEFIDRIVLVHKLREVRVQVGFTRFEAASQSLEGDFDLAVEPARITLGETWLPAAEIRGEGVLLVLREEAVREWEQREAVRRRARELLEGHRRWAAERKSKFQFPGARFVMLHSLAHLLITDVSLECGYAAASIRERIYCAPADEEVPMAAVLLYTGTPGAEGTLGGLVEVGRRLVEHVAHARDFGMLCSNDPVCAQHRPSKSRTGRYLEGAACHGCVLISEPSCERQNQYLDRALVVPTVQDEDAAFLRR